MIQIKRYLLLSTAFLSAGLCKAQVDIVPANAREIITRVNLLGFAGISIERSLGSCFTIRPEVGLGWPAIQSGKDVNDKTTLSVEHPINPYAQLEGRYYYNIPTRIVNKKNVSKFSANYLTLLYQYNTFDNQPPISDNSNNAPKALKTDVQYIAFCWGLQRSISRNGLFYFDLSIGPALKTNWHELGEFAVFGHLGLGIQW